MQLTQRRDTALKALADRQLIGQEQPVVGLLDLDAVDENIAALNEAFSVIPQTLHTVACKAVTLVPVLRYLASKGMGCEVASPGEFVMAEAAGFPPERIVLDSPAKTAAEIRYALTVGASANIDSYQEMERVDEIRAELERTGELAASSIIGVRVNPVVGTGSIGAMSTATTTTKFGIAIVDPPSEDQLVEAVAARPFIEQLHVHTGSQGVPMELAGEGIKKIVELARRINLAAGYGQIRRIDMGGGLSVNFTSDVVTPTFFDYVEVLKGAVPDLFSGDFEVVTEFGRGIMAKPGDIVTKVEYTKDVGHRRFAIGHAGAQTATRTAFAPEHWPLRVSAYGPDGTPLTNPARLQDIAGPCCFTGDMIGRSYDLPELSPGDLVCVHDTGAYYYSTPFAYNALPRIPVYAYRVTGAEQADVPPEWREPGAGGAQPQVRFTQVRKQQSVEELLVEAGAGMPDLL